MQNKQKAIETQLAHTTEQGAEVLRKALADTRAKRERAMANIQGLLQAARTEVEDLDTRLREKHEAFNAEEELINECIAKLKEEDNLT